MRRDTIAVMQLTVGGAGPCVGPAYPDAIEAYAQVLAAGAEISRRAA